MSLAKLTLVAACLMLVFAGIANAIVFANTTPIQINSTTTPQAASPYPSQITVSGLTGSITDVNVTLHNLSHTYPADLDILLVGPGGQKMILMSDAGGDPDAVNVNVTLDQQATNALPPPPAGLPSGTYRPTDYPEDTDGCLLPDTYPSPAPAGPYGTSLNIFNGLAGSSMNGVWSLYVVDECATFDGQIAGGWSLDILTANATVPVVPYGSEYRYQTYPLGATPPNWASVAFDDSAFPVGSAPFGTGPGGICPLQSTVNTLWPTPSELLLRREFSLPAGASGVKITLGVDRDAKVAINGTELTPDWLTHEGCPALDDFVITVSDLIIAEGTNLLAVLGRESQLEAFLDLQVTANVPTAVVVRSVTASRSGSGVVVRWRTASETKIVGFNVHRERGGRLVKLNRSLIPSVFGGTASGHAYSWLDRSAPGGAARYRLQTVSLSGTKSWVGSATVAR